MTDRAAVSVLERAIANYRQELLSNDAAALRAVLDVYRPVRARLVARIADLETALAESGRISAADVLRLDRARELLAQTEAELARLAGQAETIIDAAKRQALTLAADHAQGLALVTAATDGAATLARVRATWTRLNTGAAEQIAGRLTQGSPLRTLLDNIGAGAGDKIADALRGIGRDRSQSTRHRRDPGAAGGRIGARLLLIAQTEQLNSYRGASHQNFLANEDILSGMVWTCSKSTRTCITCLSMDGTVYPLTSSFNKMHPACRCSWRPALKGVEPNDIPTGTDWFYEQPVSEQLKMIRRSARDDFEAGRLRIEDFVKVDESELWGQSHRVGGVGYARDQAARRRESGTTLPKPRAAREAVRAADDGDLVTVRERAA